MDRITITIHPPPSDEGLLRITDAMQQVIDYILVLEQAELSLIPPEQQFDWRLERASTNTPFTVVAVAEPRNRTVNISPAVTRVKREVSAGITQLIRDGRPPDWMRPETVLLTRGVFARNQNGIGRTEINFEADAPAISIDRSRAEAGLRAIAAINVMEVSDIGEREAFGEIEGVMVAAGRYRNRPAIQIRTELYGFVWCTLAKAVIERFGSEHSMADIWEGKTVAVHGRLGYGVGGKLTRVEALDVREVISASPMDLDSVLDPDFTSGLDPNEYLRRLHEGELA